MQSTKFVTSVTWIKRGVCQENVKKPEDMRTDELSDVDDEDEDIDEDEEEEEDEDEDEAEGEAEDEEEEEEDDEADSIDDEDEFDFKNYDAEDDGVPADGAGLFDGLACFANNDSDPYMTLKDDDDMSDVEDTRIKPDDNVIVVANIKKDCNTLDFYVYNEAEDDCFIHHSIPLVTTPICTEWIGYRADTAGPGNFLAVGNMTPKIEFWEIDDADSIQPAFTLGSSKKKIKSGTGKEGHLDAVLDLAWNSCVGHVIASGSADATVKLWDILSGKVVATMAQFGNKVQSLQWHPFEPNNLLSGSCDTKARIFDCRDPKKASKEWLCDGEVERVLWNQFDPFYCLASTSNGMVYCFDARAKESVWTLSAHPSASVTGLALSSSCPGCLITSSTDEHIKVWDILDKKPSFVYEEKLKVKKIFVASASPDSPFVLCCGGDNKNHNFKIVDLSQVQNVMKKFRGRPLVCVDRSTAFVSDDDDDVDDHEEPDVCVEKTNTSEKRPKSGKKKPKNKKQKKKQS